MLDILKYIFIVIGIIIVGSVIVFALGNLMLSIIDPHARDKKSNKSKSQEQQITYEPQKLITNDYETNKTAENTQNFVIVNQPQTVQPQEVVEVQDVKDVDLEKARLEEELLNKTKKLEELTRAQNEENLKRQQEIENNIADKNEIEEQSNQVEEIVNFDTTEEQSEELELDEFDFETESDETDEDINALISRILNANSDEEDIAEQSEIPQEAEAIEEEAEKVLEEIAEIEEIESQKDDAEAEKVDEIIEKEIAEIEQENVEVLKIKELEELLARQKEEYEARLASLIAEKDEQTSNYEKQLAEKEIEKENLKQEHERILAEKEQETEGPTLSLEEYEARLETLRERLKSNEKELKPIKKEYLPLARIKRSLEKDKVKLRRKETIVANQKVVLYGVNNLVDINEEKAKKLAEDLDLLDGLRSSVQHCEEILKANEDRYPILESSYKILVENNENIKLDIAECIAKIEEIKAKAEEGTQE